jgi:hypothetical protein
MVSDTSGHCRDNAQRLVNPAKVIVQEVNRHLWKQDFVMFWVSFR